MRLLRRTHAPPANCGRTRIWCSDRCKKAAYEARRSGREHAVSVKVVERVVVKEHHINECVRRVQASPVALRHVLYQVVGLVDARTLLCDPKWQRALRAVEALQNALIRTRWDLR
jgi:hypothetical protein